MTDFNSFSLKGKVIIQFGGTGLLGRALVKSLASARATLVVASRNRAALQSLADSEQGAGRTVLIETTDMERVAHPGPASCSRPRDRDDAGPAQPDRRHRV